MNPVPPPLEEQLNTFLRKSPTLGQRVYVARTAVVLGDVALGDFSSVWYNAVVRGDINRIVIGHHTNIQDTVGHECLIGMGAVVLDGAVIGDQCLIGARALVTSGTRIPAGSLVLGAPAAIVRALTGEERRQLKSWAEKYVQNASYCLQHGINLGTPLPT